MFSVDKESKELGTKEAKHYHTSVSRLLYLQSLYLYTKVKCNIESDLTRLDRVMEYLSLAKHKRRLIPGDGNMERIFVFIDASFSVYTDGKGHTSLLIIWGNVAVTVARKKHKIFGDDSLN